MMRIIVHTISRLYCMTITALKMSTASSLHSEKALISLLMEIEKHAMNLINSKKLMI
jgi:hypothetical protein